MRARRRQATFYTGTTVDTIQHFPIVRAQESVWHDW